MTQATNPSVIRFEREIHAKNHEAACNELLAILQQIDSNFGGIDNIECDIPQQLNNPELGQEKIVYFCTRLASAITTLFTDPNLQISDDGALRFLVLQRWLNMVFASSPYYNADHILAAYHAGAPEDLYTNFLLRPDPLVLNKFCIFYLPESNININLDLLWERNPELTASLAFALQSPRFIGTPAAFNKRGVLLQWFPEKLAQLPNLNRVPSGISHDVYMHCSYDIAANKHDVKGALNKVIRGHLLGNGWQDCDVSKLGEVNGKPVMFVLLEHFHAAHSIYRTHSTSMIAAREHFHIIGFGGKDVDQAGRNVFDEFIELSSGNIFDSLREIRNRVEEYHPAVFYMPSIGMDLKTIFASNTRLAPVQVIALGHPGTTHSEFIEYVIVEDDYVGSEECFSETLLRLPKDALPYVPSALAPESVEYRLIENPEVVNIGVAATTMKLNPYFLDACRVIRDRAKVKVHFHFALGQSSGVTHPYVEKFIRSYLGKDATVHQHAPYHDYLRTLYGCDMMINPFPFGNTNGIIDMVTLGLVGVCKTGPEVHEHIDEGLFKRLGLPEWLITHTADEYVDCAVRLAENHEERLALRRHIIENNGLQTLFSGNPKPMGEVLLKKVQELPQFQAKAKPTRKKAAPKTDAKAAPKTAKKSPAKKAEPKTAAPRTRKTAKKDSQ
ncbi:adhesin [Neisseria sp. ZJ106]|uniref:Adhesin n=1 Tax=Neisseria lisongii TaxID=2912188 RepID=A0ABY7RLQ5_9NEIS|nr:adhesin [Neisseria lisongii]MCF7522042.1 adhesin [Neisseria lisongii]WCL72153.1 adhesin [Neisseria lisongii]